ncbi:MAG: hypothetical protein PHC66_04105 [Candidatus Nanoarchaeia archaeon]|nr:hypothetical protein [Candidatus Nanoarchaeia archaeon]MDD5238891.1 hypothetical protein [Candidatus Nanoarchaeia archaeon]
MAYESRNLAPYFGKTIKTKNLGYAIEKDGTVIDLMCPNSTEGKLFRIAALKKENFETTNASKRFKHWKKGEYTFSESIDKHYLYLPVLDELINEYGQKPEPGLLLILGFNSKDKNGRTLWTYRAFSEITDILDTK